MPSLKFTAGFIFSGELIRTMLRMVQDSLTYNIEYGTFLYRKHGLIYPNIVCQGTADSIHIEGNGHRHVGKFHTHPQTSFDESMEDAMGMLRELVQSAKSGYGQRIECIYGFKEGGIKCREYACIPVERSYILKFLPTIKNEDNFKVKFLELMQRLTVTTNVYTIKELEQAVRS